MLKKIAFILILFGVSGCFSPDEIRLNDAQKNKIAAERAAAEMKTLLPKLQQNCEATQQQWVKRITDSLINIHLEGAPQTPPVNSEFYQSK